MTGASAASLSQPDIVTAFWHSVRHARPLAIGLNLRTGCHADAPYIQELNRMAEDTFISCYPTPVCPTP